MLGPPDQELDELTGRDPGRSWAIIWKRTLAEFSFLTLPTLLLRSSSNALEQIPLHGSNKGDSVWIEMAKKPWNSRGLPAKAVFAELTEPCQISQLREIAKVDLTGVTDL